MNKIWHDSDHRLWLLVSKRYVEHGVGHGVDIELARRIKQCSRIFEKKSPATGRVSGGSEFANGVANGSCERQVAIAGIK
jgi:hypothetical protein